MRDNLRGEALVKLQAMASHTVFRIPDGQHIRPLLVYPMTVTTPQLFTRFRAKLLWFQVHFMVERHPGTVFGMVV
jgi:hypothetical protein